MRKTYIYLSFVLIFVFLNEKILTANNYIKYAFVYFVISFSLYLVLNVKDIWYALRYELIVRDKNAPVVIFILKLISIVYYLFPLILFLYSFYDYKVYGNLDELILFSTFVFTAYSVKKILKD